MSYNTLYGDEIILQPKINISDDAFANYINDPEISIYKNEKFLYITNKIFNKNCPFISIRTLCLITERCCDSDYFGIHNFSKSRYSCDLARIFLKFDYLRKYDSNQNNDNIIYETFATSELCNDIKYLIDTIILNNSPSIVNDTVMFLFNNMNKLLNEYTIYDIRDIQMLYKFQEEFDKFLICASKMDNIDYKPFGKQIDNLIKSKVINVAKSYIEPPQKKKISSLIKKVINLFHKNSR